MKAIGYIRLSRKNSQSTPLLVRNLRSSPTAPYSLQLLSIFTDNGQCSETFERTNFKAMEHFLHRNRRAVQYLVVMHLDRFSRDLSRALAKINELKRKYGVDVLSIDEPIDSNTSDPQVFIH